MWIFDDMAQALMIIGIALAVLDMLAFGFATLFLTVLGIALFLTGGMVSLGWLAASWPPVLISIAVLSAVLTWILWAPLKRLQNKDSQPQPAHSDLTEHSFVLEQDISPATPGKYHYSGIDWNIESESEISAGTRVQVVEVQVGVMKVTAI